PVWDRGARKTPTDGRLTDIGEERGSLLHAQNQEVSAMSGGLARLMAAVAVAGAIAVTAGLALKLIHFGLSIGPWEWLLSSGITWLVLTCVARGRGRVTTTLLGIFSVVPIVAITILTRFGVGVATAPESATAGQLSEIITLMMAMQLMPTIIFTSWATVPAGILTAFLVRRIMTASPVGASPAMK